MLNCPIPYESRRQTNFLLFLITLKRKQHGIWHGYGWIKHILSLKHLLIADWKPILHLKNFICRIKTLPKFEKKIGHPLLFIESPKRGKKVLPVFFGQTAGLLSWQRYQYYWNRLITLTLLHSERPNPCRVLAVLNLSVIGLIHNKRLNFTIFIYN